MLFCVLLCNVCASGACVPESFSYVVACEFRMRLCYCLMLCVMFLSAPNVRLVGNVIA